MIKLQALLATLAVASALIAPRPPVKILAPQKAPTRLLAPLRAEAAPAEPAPVAASAEAASVAASTINLVKSIVGAGVLALPAGVAAFADAKPALWPATVVISLLGGASAYPRPSRNLARWVPRVAGRGGAAAGTRMVQERSRGGGAAGTRIVQWRRGGARGAKLGRRYAGTASRSSAASARPTTSRRTRTPGPSPSARSPPGS